MPKRRDFDVEFDNDAELLLAEMEFNGNILFLNHNYLFIRRRYSR